MDTLTPYAVSNGLAPLDQSGNVNPLAMPVIYDFSAVAVIEKDYWQDQANGIIGAVQTVYVDNSDNANPLNFLFQGTGFKLHVPAFCSGFFPVVAPTHLHVTISTVPDAALNKVQCVYLNVPMPSQEWGPVTVNVQNVNATFTPSAGVFANFSGAIAAPSVSQALFPANANAIRRIVSNPSVNAQSLFINFGGAAAGPNTSIEIMPGGWFDTQSGPIDQTSWTIFSQAVQPYVAKELV